MLEQRKKQVLAAYQKLKKTDRLSVNLLNPTTANLRNECAARFKVEPDQEIKKILESFTGHNLIIETSLDILNIDADKFKPLRNYMKGDIASPSAQTKALLLWLINFEILNKPNSEPANKYLTKNKKIFIVLTVLAVIIAVYILWPRCMYWDGVSYQRISCDDGAASDFMVIKLDKERLANFKRITKLDTINYKDIGRIWYMKINGVHEFYTVPGMHPVEERKQLKPITKYIIDKYILKKDSLVIVNVGKNK